MIVKDYSSCPPKKRPLPMVVPDSPYYGVNENEAPEDLSLKKSLKFQEVPNQEKIATPFGANVISSSLSRPMKPAPVMNYSLAKPFYNNDENNNSAFTDGLQLISEVASKVEAYRPSVLRGPGNSIGPLLKTYSSTKPALQILRTVPYIRPSFTSSSAKENERIYIPSTASTNKAKRVTLGERGNWSYNPYLPLAVYGLSSPSYSIPYPSNYRTQPLKEIPLSETIKRSSSISPPSIRKSDCSSSSEGGSPELRGEKLICPDCKREYTTVSGLSRHQQFHCTKDSAKTFICSHCPKTYTSMGALKMHIRTHTLPCKCHLCGKAFSRPWLLQGHIRTHTGEKPFECTQCHRSFADRSNLRAHLQTHAEVKKYACSNCPKTFSRMSLLIKHQDHGCPGLVQRNESSVALLAV